MIFLFIFCNPLFSCTQRGKSVPFLPAQPRSARHYRRRWYPVAMLHRCGAK